MRISDWSSDGCSSDLLKRKSAAALSAGRLDACLCLDPSNVMREALLFSGGWSPMALGYRRRRWREGGPDRGVSGANCGGSREGARPPLPAPGGGPDRKRVVLGKCVTGRVEPGGSRIT